MDMFVVRGGRPLSGRVAVGGAKNAALPVMAAALAAEGRTVLHNVPELQDVSTLALLLTTLGLEVSRRDEDGALVLEPHDERPCVADYELVRRMRASFCVLGPLLARRRRACVSLPGGCNIGDRPIDLHLKGLKALGADIRIERGYVFAEAERLRGADIYLGGPFGSTVTGTCNVMTAAALADGVTTIESAACEPEVIDLGTCLNAMGARITGLGTPFVRIEGVDRLQGVEHTILPDRIEAVTLMIAAAVTGGRIELENACPGHMTAVIEKLREIGVRIEAGPQGSGGRSQASGVKEHVTTDDCDHSETQTSAQDSMPGIPHTPSVSPPSTFHLPPSRNHPRPLQVSGPAELQAADCIVLPYPGIPTDVQAQLMALLAKARGMSLITDKVFPDRFMHASELARLGAQIRREGPTAVINGVSQLSGACVMASDLRASAALVLAALAAEGESVVRRIYHLDRGYERLEVKLNRLGADIRRLEDAPHNMPAGLAPTFPNAEEARQRAAASLAGPKWLQRPADEARSRSKKRFTE